MCTKCSEMLWSLFFAIRVLTKQALYSYDDFVSRIVPEVIDNHRPIELKPSLQIFDESTPPHKIQISNVRYDIPSCVEKNGDIRRITPMEARRRDLISRYQCMSQSDTQELSMANCRHLFTKMFSLRVCL